MIIIRYIASILICLFLLISCNKESFYSGTHARLQFSSDTISFDTVFTTFGTATKGLTVYNPYNQSLKVNIAFSGAQDSVFLININGINTSHLNNIDIKPKDSLFIFLQVLINTLSGNLPLLIKDSIMFTVNNNAQYIYLEAFGQNVHFLNNQVLTSQTWLADKPYLIYGNVTVDTLQTLTIEPGTSIYMHRNANLRVKGTLQASGAFATPIVFNTDRLDPVYNDVPGQWGGIILLPGSKNHMLNWVIMKNGTSGLTLGGYTIQSKPDLILSNSIINNMSYSCLLAINSQIKAWNCQITDAGNYSCGLIGGGDYQFYQCTLANDYGKYVSRSYNIPTLYISDYYNNPSNVSDVVINPLSEAIFANTIAYGNTTNEMTLDLKQTAPSAYLFNHCLLVSSDSAQFISSPSFISVIFNKDPKFQNPDQFKFELDSLSPAIKAGDVATGLLFPFDLKLINRTLKSAPDIGAYEWVQK